MRNALVTGASRGLGLALARALAERGWSLVVDARGADALEAARRELAPYTRVAAIAGDVADADHRRDLVAAVDGPLDLVVRVNVVAPLALIQLALPVLAPGARIVNVSSDAAVEAYEGWGGYGASKAALDQLTNVLGAEREDVRVYAVDPGDMNTRMQQDAYPGEDVSDRPPPEKSVPGLLTLIEGELPSGRYAARELALPVHA